MPLDNSPRLRQARRLQRRQNIRAPYDRVLIVAEGSKTEPQYFNEIKQFHRLQSANIQIAHSHLGTDPLQVVESAELYFLHGIKDVPPRAFDAVYAVFDRDEHRGYCNALHKAASLNDKLKNDERRRIPFVAVPSNPCFEFWLLLHFMHTPALLHRHEVLHRLKTYLSAYDKGMPDVFLQTQDKLAIATQSAVQINAGSSPHSTMAPYTEVVSLVHKLMRLKD